jgi:glyoxylase-like metal-dependent hydrolase (beta-lactamase superfamily II)
MKRVLAWIGGVVVVLALVIGGFWYTVFGRNSPIVDAAMLVPGVETVKDGFVSAFIIDVAPGKVALVDAGHDDSGKALLAALARRNLTPAAVTAIFLTHGHPDHMAGVKLFPGAQVYALASELPLIGAAVKVDHPLNDGDVTEVGDARVETFALPGHTPGSAAFLARGVLFFGDSAGASKEGFMMPAVSLISKDPAVNVASLKALEARLAPRAADIKILAYAHTGPLPGFDPFVKFVSTH